jgi:phenylacetate-CoA ligase
VTSWRELLLGHSYYYHRHLIRQSLEWSAAEIARYQQDRLDRLIDRYGSEITSKEDYRLHGDRYSAWRLPLLTRTIRTGGSSGDPLRFQIDTVARRQKELAYIFDIWAMIGYRPFDLRVVYRGNVHDGLWRYEPLQNRWIVSPSSTSEDRIADLRRWARGLEPFFLHVYPGSLYTFIDLLGEDLFARLPVRGVLAGSESFPTGAIEQFERDYGIPVAHWYGHSEFAALAYRCRTCGGFHFYPTYGCVELVDTGNDNLSRIIASSLNRIGTRFVRYDTGDLATPPARACDGNFLQVREIVGRVHETFVDLAGRRRALGCYIFGIHGEFWDQLRDLQFVQERDGHLRVRLVPADNQDRAFIERTLRRRLPMAVLEFDYVAQIDRRTNGKRQYFVDTRGAHRPGG